MGFLQDSCAYIVLETVCVVGRELSRFFTRAFPMRPRRNAIRFQFCRTKLRIVCWMWVPPSDVGYRSAFSGSFPMRPVCAAPDGDTVTAFGVLGFICALTGADVVRRRLSHWFGCAFAHGSGLAMKAARYRRTLGAVGCAFAYHGSVRCQLEAVAEFRRAHFGMRPVSAAPDIDTVAVCVAP